MNFDTSLKDTFEGGRLFEHNGIKILDLRGSWKQMGRQYGYLAADMIKDVCRNFLRSKITAENEAAIWQMTEDLYHLYPYRLKQVFAGMLETSGLTMNELKLANAAEYTAAVYGCSAMAAWNDYASGNLIYGRNYDGPGFQPLCHDIVVVVYHPSDGSLATATVGYAGEIYAVNAFNEKGLFVELNNGMPSAGTDIDFSRFAGTTELLTMMMDADSMEYVDGFFKTVKGFASFTIGVADEYEARSYEWCAQGMARGDGSTPDGLMAMTNHYVSPTWEFPVPDDDHSWISIQRRNNLLNQAATHKGYLDAPTMCQIMQTYIPDGGPRHEFTLYQLVFEPATMKLRMQITEVNEWEEIELGKLFGMEN